MQTSADRLVSLGGRAGMRAFIRPKTHPGDPRGFPGPLVTLDNLGSIARPPRRRRLIRMSALSAVDGSIGGYHGDHG